METVEDAPRNRRSFLGQLGTMVAAGLGLRLLTSRSAEATTSACAIFCSQRCGTTPCGDAGTCGGGQNCFYCTTLCGYNFWACLSHGCSSYCYSPNAC